MKVTTQNLLQESTDLTDDSSLGMTADFAKTRYPEDLQDTLHNQWKRRFADDVTLR